MDWLDLCAVQGILKNSSVLSFLYGPTLTSIHDYWKNRSLDYADLWWQSNVSAFQNETLETGGGRKGASLVRNS